jgi:hypothetical protein
LSDLLSHGPPELRPRLVPNPLPRTRAGRLLVTGLSAVLVVSSLTMVSASAVAEYRGDVAAALFGGHSTVDVDKRLVASEPADPASSSAGTADEAGAADAAGTADTEGSRLSATARGSLLPLTLLAVGLTGVGFSAVRVRRRTIDAARPERVPRS